MASFPLPPSAIQSHHGLFPGQTSQNSQQPLQGRLQGIATAQHSTGLHPEISALLLEQAVFHWRFFTL